MSDDNDSNDSMVLFWYEDNYIFYIAWGDEDGPGLCLGEDMNSDMPDHKVATEAAATIGPPTKGRLGRLEWETETAVRKALRAAKAAVKAWAEGVPLPDWALRAQADGWKPPKTWKPQPGSDIAKSQYLRGGAEGWEAAVTMLLSLPLTDGPLAEFTANQWRAAAAELRRQADAIDKVK